jgi:beta-glucanase (GH16 family)
MLRKQSAARSWRSIRWPLAGAVALVVVLIAGYAIYTVVQNQRSKVVWSDDFTGAAGAAPNKNNWLFTTGTSYPGGAPQFGTGEVQTYTDDRAHVSLDGNGHLVITATRDAGGAWRSGRIETRRTDFEPTADGTLEVAARIKVPPPSPGYWPAFWMLGKGFRGNYVNWPGIGEIDIMEWTPRDPGTVIGTMHCGVAPGGPCRENDGLSGRYTMPDGKPLSADFHTYSVQWDRSRPQDEIRWYVDGHSYHTVRAGDVDPATWANATNHGFFVLLNVAIGGALPGPPDASTTPGGSMVVDSVSVTRK